MGYKGFAFMLGWLDGGPFLSCTNFAGGGGQVIFKVIIGNMHFLVKGFPINLPNIVRFGILFMVLLYGPLGLKAMARFPTNINSTNPRLSTTYGKTSLCTPRQLEKGL